MSHRSAHESGAAGPLSIPASADARDGAPRTAPPRRIDCEPEPDERTRGTPRSGRGRGIREDAPAGRSRPAT